MSLVEGGVSSVLIPTQSKDDLREVSVRILLVDDFEPFLRFTALTLRKEPGFRIVGEALDGQEAVQKAKELKPDLVVLDIDLPKLNGIEAARQIRSVSPDSRILFLTGDDDPQIAQVALDTGARGYVVKLNAAAELLPAVKAVLLGKRYVSKQLAVDDPNHPLA
jgi:DNA-binding NarL/FixJ family response regulator